MPLTWHHAENLAHPHRDNFIRCAAAASQRSQLHLCKGALA